MKFIFKTLAVVFSLGLLSTQAQAGESVNFGLANSTPLATRDPYVKAQVENKSFETNGIDLKVTNVGVSSTKMFLLVAAGRLDMALGSFVSLVELNGSTENPELVAILLHENSASTALMARRETTIDLSTKTVIGTHPNAASKMMFPKVFDASNVVWEHMGFKVRMPALISKQVDATIGPWGGLMQGHDPKDFNWTLFAEGDPDIMGDVIVVSKKYLEENRDLVQRVVALWIQNVEDFKTNPPKFSNARDAEYFNFHYNAFVMTDTTREYGVGRLGATPEQRLMKNVADINEIRNLEFTHSPADYLDLTVLPAN
tara:strand:- start:1653 stop:2594 length:942 start_codon:yes stop_codon:yes gene_type:complete